MATKYDNYFHKFGHYLSFNDATLIYGGRFDNALKKGGGRDALCHESYRKGIDIDVNKDDEIGDNIKVEKYFGRPRLRYLTDLAKSIGLVKVKEKSIHYRYIKGDL